jgi:hypothetical protein
MGDTLDAAPRSGLVRRDHRRAGLSYVPAVNEMSAATLEPHTVGSGTRCRMRVRTAPASCSGSARPNGKPGWQGSTLAPSENPVTRR